MNAIKSKLREVVGQAAGILAELRTPCKSTVKLEQLEFSFGMVREFSVDENVRRKMAGK